MPWFFILASYCRNKIKDGVNPTGNVNKMTLESMESSPQSNTEGEVKNVPEKGVSQSTKA